MMQVAIREQIPKSRNPAGGQPNGGICSTSTKNYSKPDANNQLSFIEVKKVAYGKWESIHRALGIQLKTMSHAKHTACQGCGGKDRFRVMPDYANTGRWICGGGVGNTQVEDGFELLGHVFGWTPQEQLKAVADYLGLSNMDESKKKALRIAAEKREREVQATIAKRYEQTRRDSDVLTMLENLIDEIRFRQHLQREAMKFNKAFIAEPTIDEVNTAQELNAAILEAYAHQKGVDYV
ncbi:primase-helicase zinc-binding domain-containing protein [Thiothrix lacustris]|uniref:primase-helicase zinc-binding domain-containing protein n=1 Tax=Thiothrix lacustris TaxID=525917 RepID=UPI00048CC085|nr:primase-helicase zinc-binding domain-containing protein [Thiothrix lacustris]